MLFPLFEDVLEAGAIIGLDVVPLSNSFACLILFVSTDTLSTAQLILFQPVLIIYPLHDGKKTKFST